MATNHERKMAATEKQIKMAAKLYECRDTAKKFFKEDYSIKIKPYEIIIKKVMEANKVDEINALLIISKTNTYLDNAMAQMLFMSAIVEMIEPS